MLDISKFLTLTLKISINDVKDVSKTDLSNVLGPSCYCSVDKILSFKHFKTSLTPAVVLYVDMIRWRIFNLCDGKNYFLRHFRWCCFSFSCSCFLPFMFTTSIFHQTTCMHENSYNNTTLLLCNETPCDSWSRKYIISLVVHSCNALVGISFFSCE